MKNLYYVGFRESDIWESPNYKGSLTKFGTNLENNISFSKYRLNPFKNTKQIHRFFQKNLLEIIEKDDNAKFVFYNPISAYNYGEKVYSHSITGSSLALLKLVNDRFFMRQLVQREIPTPNSFVLGSRLINNLFLISDNKKYVIQNDSGSGGTTTMIVDSDEKTLKLSPREYYLVSEFIQNTTSLSVHIIISKENIYVFQPSVQIIKNDRLYYGADYSKFYDLHNDIKDKINAFSKIIGEKVRSLGYYGILGIDYIEASGELYFIEINPRFMGSTLLLNKHLIDKGFKTLQEYHIDAIKGNELHLEKYNFDERIPLKNHIIFNGESFHTNSDKITYVYDGYHIRMKAENNAYLYTVIEND